jgi:hypothetical protein
VQVRHTAANGFLSIRRQLRVYGVRVATGIGAGAIEADEKIASSVDCSLALMPLLQEQFDTHIDRIASDPIVPISTPVFRNDQPLPRHIEPNLRRHSVTVQASIGLDSCLVKSNATDWSNQSSSRGPRHPFRRRGQRRDRAKPALRSRYFCQSAPYRAPPLS